MSNFDDFEKKISFFILLITLGFATSTLCPSTLTFSYLLPRPLQSYRLLAVAYLQTIFLGS